MLGRGEETHRWPRQGLDPRRHVEAVIGAVYLSCGMPAAARLVHHLLDPLMAQSATLGAGLDWKTSLQELAARHRLGVPEYRVDEEGPDHEKTFHARWPSAASRSWAPAPAAPRRTPSSRPPSRLARATGVRDRHEAPGADPRRSSPPRRRRPVDLDGTRPTRA